MGTLLAFAVGYIIGANAGAEGFDEVVQRAQAVRDSDEFKKTVDVLRQHAQRLARSIGDWVGIDGEDLDL